MLFNSHEFFLVFLPIVFLLFWYGGRSLRWRLGLLTAASYVFYSWWQFDSWTDVLSTDRMGGPRGPGGEPMEMAIHAGDAAEQHGGLPGGAMDRADADRALELAQTATRLSLAANLGLLGFFKYFGFFEKIVSDLTELAGGGAAGHFDGAAGRDKLLHIRVDELRHRHLPRRGQAGQELPGLRLLHLVLSRTWSPARSSATPTSCTSFATSIGCARDRTGSRSTRDCCSSRSG